MTVRWDPETYLGYADERSRPFLDLLARVRPGGEVRDVVDLGCGPGNLTELLTRRWPDADVLGIDSSAEMIATARAGAAGRYRQADMREWVADAGPVDVLVSNAALQWVPDHLALVPALAALVRPGGAIAIQVPGNQNAPSHALMRAVGAREPYAEHLAALTPRGGHDPEAYLGALTGAGLAVDAWETTYTHVLAGPEPVLRWVSGTGLRPYLAALPEHLRADFVAEYAAELREAYPECGYGTPMPFRRVFAVGHRG